MNNICLDEFRTMAENYFYLGFQVLDKSGIPMDLTDFETTIKIAKFGDIRNVVATIDGTVDVEESRIDFLLDQNETFLWSGKYIYQVFLENISTGQKMSPKQGVFMVVPRIDEFGYKDLLFWSEHELSEMVSLPIKQLL